MPCLFPCLLPVDCLRAYAAFSKDPDFHRFVKSLDAAPTHDLTKNETYALFMNAYNAFATYAVGE